MRRRLNSSPPPLPPPSGKSCASSRPRRGFSGASTSVLALFSPASGRAGTDLVGASPCLARVGLVASRERMKAPYAGKAARTVGQGPKHGMRIPIPLFLCAAMAGTTAASWAQPAQDPLKSPACAQALQALESARASSERSATEGLRQEAARICLGQPDPPARPARSVQAPVAIPSLQRPDTRSLTPAPATPPPPVAIGRPSLPAQCDPAGCWVNDGGTHLRHVPAPAASCIGAGTQVYCP